MAKPKRRKAPKRTTRRRKNPGFGDYLSAAKTAMVKHGSRIATEMAEEAKALADKAKAGAVEAERSKALTSPVAALEVLAGSLGYRLMKANPRKRKNPGIQRGDVVRLSADGVRALTQVGASGMESRRYYEGIKGIVKDIDVIRGKSYYSVAWDGASRGMRMGEDQILSIRENPRRLRNPRRGAKRRVARKNPRKQQDLSAVFALCEKSNTLARRYNKVMNAAYARYGEKGAFISGIGQDHFPESVKSDLVSTIRAFTKAQEAVWAAFKIVYPRTSVRSKSADVVKNRLLKAGGYGLGNLKSNPRRR